MLKRFRTKKVFRVTCPHRSTVLVAGSDTKLTWDAGSMRGYCKVELLREDERIALVGEQVAVASASISYKIPEDTEPGSNYRVRITPAFPNSSKVTTGDYFAIIPKKASRSRRMKSPSDAVHDTEAKPSEASNSVAASDTTATAQPAMSGEAKARASSVDLLPSPAPAGAVLFAGPPEAPKPPAELTAQLTDDHNSHGRVSGESLVMSIEDVYYTRLEVPGTLVMTSYQLYFRPERLAMYDPDGLRAYVSIPLGSIEQISFRERSGRAITRKQKAKKKNRLISHTLNIVGKDMNVLSFGFSKEQQPMGARACECLERYIFPAKNEYMFAFDHARAVHGKVHVPPEFDGWQLYDPVAELGRLGLPNKQCRLSDINKDYELCSSYPAYWCVPAAALLSDKELRGVAQFRCKGRLPVLAWKHPAGPQTLWRCAQPKVGMNGARSEEDEKLLEVINALNPKAKTSTIFDCRPKINAMGNKVAGKGFEDTQFYPNWDIRFMNIQNIHAMRNSYKDLTKACSREGGDFLASVESSGWLGHLSLVLAASFQMVLAMDHHKQSIISHCSDGWDRTTQLCTITEICLDPYYRTTRGFFVLIEKEWLSFGHKFHQRLGHRDANHSDEQRSPIFIQWLDVIYQLTVQFPRHFQFNSNLLVTIARHIYSCRFGTFLCNTQKERLAEGLQENTISLWTYLLASPAAVAGEFTNPLYCPTGRGAGYAGSGVGHEDVARYNDLQESGAEGEALDSSMRFVQHAPAPFGNVIYPSSSLKKIALWRDYFLRFNEEEPLHGGIGPGSVPTASGPGNACVATLQSNHRLMEWHLVQQQHRIAQLEQRLRDLGEQVAEDAVAVEQKGSPQSHESKEKEDDMACEEVADEAIEKATPATGEAEELKDAPEDAGSSAQEDAETQASAQEEAATKPVQEEEQESAATGDAEDQ